MKIEIDPDNIWDRKFDQPPFIGKLPFNFYRKAPKPAPTREALTTAPLSTLHSPPHNRRQRDKYYQHAVALRPQLYARNCTQYIFSLLNPTCRASYHTYRLEEWSHATTYAAQQRRCADLVHNFSAFHDDLGAGILWARAK